MIEKKRGGGGMMSMKAEHLQSVNKLREKYIWYIFTRNDIYDKYYMIDGVEIPSKCIFMSCTKLVCCFMTERIEFS